MKQPTQDFLDNALFLVDASSYIFRAYYAIQSELKAPDGTPTHATYGFLQMLHSLMSSHKIKRCALVWDRPEKGFRHQIFPQYKANRGAPPEDLGIQIENSKKGAHLLGLLQLEASGFEADDIIAAVVDKFPEQNIVVVTGDKDLLQLVGPNCWCLDTSKNKFSNETEAKEKFGVVPSKIAEVQALMGDSVDNIPGAPGIGPKGAQELIHFFGSLDKVLQEAKQRDLSMKAPKEDPLKGRKLESFKNNIELIETSLKLVSLNRQAPCPTNTLDFELGSTDKSSFQEWSHSLGLEKLAQRILGDLQRKSSEPPTSTDATPNTASTEASIPFSFESILLNTEDALKKVLNEHLNHSIMSLDTETRSLDSRSSNNIVGVSFCFEESKAYYIPLSHQNASNLDISVFNNCWRDFFRVSQLKSILFQNAKFDLHVLEQCGFPQLNPYVVEDTMVASYVLDPSASHGMDALAQRHLNYNTQSFESVLGENKSFDQVSVEDACFYSAEDALVTFKLWNVLSRELKQKGLFHVYEKMDRPLIPVLKDIENAGIKVDLAFMSELSQHLHLELQKNEAEALSLLRSEGIEIPEQFNLSSTKQIAWVLFEKLKLPIIKEGKTGPSTDVEVLEELSLQHGFPKILLELRELNKLLSTYVDALPKLVNAETHKLHTHLSQTVAVTGRLASSNPNLQNIPIKTARGREMRKAFVANPNRVLIGADYSQVELRVLAQITQDFHLVEAFKKNQDIHKKTASLILGKDESLVSDDDRRLAKSINFGIIYGQTPFGLAKTLGISRKDAQNFIEQYFKTYPGIKEYMTESIQKAKSDGYAETLFGRRRFLPALHSKNAPIRQFAERTAINSPIQGTAADIIKLAMIECSEVLQQNYPDSHLVLQVHDELIIEAPETLAASIQEQLVAIMEKPKTMEEFNLKFEVPLKVEAAIGKNWGEI